MNYHKKSILTVKLIFFIFRTKENLTKTFLKNYTAKCGYFNNIPTYLVTNPMLYGSVNIEQTETTSLSSLNTKPQLLLGN